MNNANRSTVRNILLACLISLSIVTHVTAGSTSYLVIDLSAGPTAEHYPTTIMDEIPAEGWTDEYKTAKLVLRRIPAGTFIMGSPEDELGRWDHREKPREVTLTQDYYIGVFPITQRQWYQVMGNWPGRFTNPEERDTRALERIRFDAIRGSKAGAEWPQSHAVDAASFMGRLRERTGLSRLDLPTEAQWEYACRAGTDTALNTGKDLTDLASCPNLDVAGRYKANAGFVDGRHYPGKDTSAEHGTSKVGSYMPNAWGLYDMHGNVWEWCLDWYEPFHAETVDPVGAELGLTRVLRGGRWNSDARECRAAYRYYFPCPSVQVIDGGFRIAMQGQEADNDNQH